MAWPEALRPARRIVPMDCYFRCFRCSAALLLVLTASTAQAQTAPPATPPVAAAAPAASAAAGKRVIEDDQVRIEETRLRGETRTVTVQSKLRGVAGYEIVMPPLGKDPSQDRGAAGQRTWSLFHF